MAEPAWLADQFERWRPHLASVAYGMLGSVGEAEDAVQQAWLRLGRSDADAIVDLRAWLTTVVGRICLDMLRARKNHPLDPVGAWLPEPLVEEAAADGPEEQALMADSVGMALLVVLESLSPAERLAFVLHDVFDMRFDEIGQIIGRTELAARQLASRARRRVRTAPRPDRDRDVQRRAVSAFLAAARHGDFEALLRVLAPGAVLRFDLGPGREPLPTLSGAEAVAGHVLQTAPRFVAFARPAIVNGTVGLLFSPGDEPLAVLSFTVSGGRIAELDLVADPAKLLRRAGHGRYVFPATSPSVLPPCGITRAAEVCPPLPMGARNLAERAGDPGSRRPRAAASRTLTGAGSPSAARRAASLARGTAPPPAGPPTPARGAASGVTGASYIKRPA